MTHYLNNCRALNHVGRYGDDAFYDLPLDQANQARGIRPGDECVVAVPLNAKGKPQGGGKMIRFCYYRLDGLTKENYPAGSSGGPYLVFRGPLLDEKTVELRKDEAVTTPPYDRFFGPEGHFKSDSVIR
jgi:hypothetical protein